MFKLYSVLFFLLITSAINAQNNIVITGTVLDKNTKLPLELATVYFSSTKDSTMIEYTTTDKKGFFKIETKKYDKPVFLKVNYIGYDDLVQKYEGLLESKDLGKLLLSERANLLDNVVVQNEAPPIRIKQDTLEFNASSYKVRPDANVELLLKELPGFDIDNDGKITVSGREVTQVLVNGKAFFDKDGAIALKNLPADIIKKVQVSDYKTKKQELAKEASTSDYSSVNLTIDEKKNKGHFGKIAAGYGSDDHYESSLLLNFFNNKQKISVLASSNNINATGFAMDEVFDNMGGGRNSKGQINFGGAKGITQSNLVGLNYSDEWFKDFDASSSYNFTNSITNNDSKVHQISFLPTGDIITETDSKTRNENTGNKVNFELEYKIDPSTRIVFTPKLNQTRSNSNSSRFSFSEDENGESLNESTSASYKEDSNTNFANSINFNKAFSNSRRNLSFVFSNNNTNNRTNDLNQSQTIFYQDNKPNDERNQNAKNDKTTDAYSLDFEYTEPITDSLRIRLGADFDWKKEINDEKTFDFNDATQSYSEINESLTNYISSKQNSVAPKAGVTFEKNKFTVNLNAKTAIVDFDNHSLYLNNVTDLNKKYVLPSANAQLRYRFERSKFVAFKYDYSSSLPSASQLLPVLDLTNPLNSIIGNPNLNTIEKNSVNLNFINFDFRTRSGYSLFARADYFNNDVVSTSIYDDSGKRTTTYANISGTYSVSVGANWNQSFKWDAHVLRYGLGINGNYSFDKGFTNAVLYNAKSTGISPRVYLSYNYGELLTIAPSYNLSYNETNYENTSRDATSQVVHRINFQTTSYWPDNFVFGNDFGYTYNSQIADEFKKDFFLWNTSLSYGFFDKKMFLKVKVYDVLNQNQSSTRTISATSIRDENNTVLKRYIMFSLAYKIGKFVSDNKKGQGRKSPRN